MRTDVSAETHPTPHRRPSIPRSFGIATLGLALLGLFPSAAPLHAQASGEGSVSLAYGTQAPSAELEDLEGNTVQLLDYVQGKPAILEFWATWCENCEELQPQLDRIQAEHGDEVSVVAVAVAVAQSIRRVKRHLEEHDAGYPYLWDEDGEAVRAYRAPTTSVVVILDSSGTVVYTGSGGSQDLVGEVERLLTSG